MNQIIIARWIVGIVIVVAAGCILWYRERTKRILKTLEKMVDQARDGTFVEMVFDESLQSMVETKMANYLTASCVSAKNLKEEKEKIKSLIADISHQTKTPIANLLLYSQLLLEQKLPEESEECVQELNAQAQKLNFLIQSLVKTSRLENGVFVLNPKKMEIHPMVDHAVSQIRSKAEAKEIQLVIQSVEGEAIFDSKWTEEALANVLDNAVKYTPVKGTITVSSSSYELFLRIDITDTGMGISEEETANIFQRFYRSQRVSEVEGVGIGLYLTRQILMNEGGYIKAASELKKGSTFSIFLPKG